MLFKKEYFELPQDEFLKGRFVESTTRGILNAAMMGGLSFRNKQVVKRIVRATPSPTSLKQ